MRRTCLAVVLAVILIAPAAAFAQESYLEVLRSDVKAERVAIITEMMAFTDEQAEVFWPIYREMVAEGDKLTDQRIAVIKEYAENYEDMTDEIAKDLMTRVFKLREKRLSIEKKYHKKFAKALDPITAAKFYQINHELMMMIDIQISSGLPFFK
jgi:hypothetical protein